MKAVGHPGPPLCIPSLSTISGIQSSSQTGVRDVLETCTREPLEDRKRGFAWRPGGPLIGFQRGIDIYDPEQLPKQVLLSSRVYTRHHWSFPNLIDPKTFTEKQLLFKFFAPIPTNPTPSDKLRSCAYAPLEIRKKTALPKRLWISDKAELPDNETLAPGSYYLKPNHGSGTNCRVSFPLCREEPRPFNGQINNPQDQHTITA
ncbi:MAG: hypothetical protein AAFR73_08695 [Pseudomonadota bacterium]